MRLAHVIICAVLGGASVAGCETAPSAEGEESLSATLVLTGGRVWTGSDASPDPAAWPSAIAVRGERIVVVGSDEEVEAAASDGATRVDLEGRLVVPGFQDAHVHFVSGGFELDAVELRDARTPEEFADRIAARARERPGEWMTGGLWDHENWGGTLPERDWIDAVTGETPVFVQRLDLHMGLANSEALARAGVDANTPDPQGGTIVRDGEGRPTGVLKDAAMDLVQRVIPTPSAEATDRAIAAAARHALERGVTSLTHMGTWADLQTFRRAHARGELPLRLYAAVQIADWDRMATFVAHDGAGDATLRWGAVKAFVDGSLGSGTAWFHEAFDDEPGNRGLVVADTARLREAIMGADAAGLQLVVHAIGDAANDWLLDVFEEVERVNGPSDRRLRIEHAQHLTPAAITRIAEQQVIASMQPYHAIDDGRWAERRIGPERARTTYAFRDLLDAGAVLAFGSDWTVAPLSPMEGIYAAVTRRTIDGAHPDGWVPEQKVSVAEALTAYTETGAFARFAEGDLGRIEVGMLADLAVLSEDIFAIDPTEIASTAVDVTVVGGEVVYVR
ncbi:MAG TPA: amidohydrolase [Longimicrobiales bacterium]|nr:amidohydrolase [Longimicrobiales bacterium]